MSDELIFILKSLSLELWQLNINNGNDITGFCFTPQDGNSILSSISATEWFLYPHSYEDKIQCLSNLFFNNIKAYMNIRLYHPNSIAENTTIILSKDHTHYVVRVMRLKAGTTIKKHTDKVDKEIKEGKIVRLHVPLRTSKNVYFYLWEKKQYIWVLIYLNF